MYYWGRSREIIFQIFNFVPIKKYIEEKTEEDKSGGREKRTGMGSSERG